MTRLLLTGASGQLGAYVLSARRNNLVAWSGAKTGRLSGTDLVPVDLRDPAAVESAFNDAKPDAVIHAAATAAVGDCYADPAGAHAVNADATGHLSGLAARHGVPMVFVSTDLVFDGTSPPYDESSPTSPLSVYGRTKADAEALVLAHPIHAVLRVSLLYGPGLAGRPTFFDGVVSALRGGRGVKLFTDEYRTPLHFATAASALVMLAEARLAGLYHLGGPERMSRYEMGTRLAAVMGVDAAAIEGVSRADTPTAEPRPADSSLDSAKLRAALPGLRVLGYEEAVAP